MPITDSFAGHTPGMEAPVASAAPITPDDAADLTHVTRAVFLGTGGDLRVTMAGGETLVFVNMAPGWHPVRVARVWATGTTAAQIIGCH